MSRFLVCDLDEEMVLETCPSLEDAVVFIDRMLEQNKHLNEDCLDIVIYEVIASVTVDIKTTTRAFLGKKEYFEGEGPV